MRNNTSLFTILALKLLTIKKGTNMKNQTRNVLLLIIAALILINFREPIKNLFFTFNKPNVTNIEHIPEEKSTNQFPFSTLEYDINLGSTQIPEEIAKNKNTLFKINCKITKNSNEFNINYKIQYLGTLNCGLSIIPITNQNQLNNSYEFVQFEPMQIIEFNNKIQNVNELKTTKPFVVFVKDNKNNNIKTFNFMTLDDVSIPF